MKTILMLYVIIGLVITQAGVHEDENYEEYVKSSVFTYIYEVLNWLPETIEHIIKNQNDE